MALIIHVLLKKYKIYLKTGIIDRNYFIYLDYSFFVYIYILFNV